MSGTPAGWMDFWPEDKKQRVINLIRDTGIGPRGRVLEYGCGVGVFAEALKHAIPSLDVHGCDISDIGVQKAAARCPDVRFHKIDSAELARLEGTFDVVYSHHVLEHVHDVSDVMRRIHALLKPGGKALHIVPCGNPGSLEYVINELTAGIDNSGRFFTDDSSHVRRLTSGELTTSCLESGFQAREAVFANQFWGGVDYLTGEYHWTLLRWLNPRCGKTGIAKTEAAPDGCIVGRFFPLAPWAGVCSSDATETGRWRKEGSVPGCASPGDSTLPAVDFSQPDDLVAEGTRMAAAQEFREWVRNVLPVPEKPQTCIAAR